jgi:hypothetical protein
MWEYMSKIEGPYSTKSHIDSITADFPAGA